MPVEITMPRLSDTMEQGTVVAWNVNEGDAVSAGDVLGDIETDKATMELQNFDDGTVAAILLNEGDTVEVGSVIMVLAEDGEDVTEIKSNAEAGNFASAAAAPDTSMPAGGITGETSSSDEEEDTTSAEPAADNSRVFASPLARKIADEQGIDLSQIQGSGPAGRIVRKDVEGFTAPPAEAAAPDTFTPARPEPMPLPAAGAALEDRVVKLTNMRATIARRLSEAKSGVPHYYVTVDANMDALLELRAKLNEQLATQNIKLTVNDFMIRACALAMHEHPFFNAEWLQEGAGASIALRGAVNIGMAVALPEERGGGLVVATIRDADRIGIRQISAEAKRLARKARDKGLSIEEMADATFTISNLGMYGVEHYTAIINPPNSAILAVGAAIKKPVVRTNADGVDELTIGSQMQMTMSGDHRVVDGAMVAQFLQTVRRYLENPATLLV